MGFWGEIACAMVGHLRRLNCSLRNVSLLSSTSFLILLLSCVRGRSILKRSVAIMLVC
uniref:Uncharacterized protein n=1 Tax=Yersinia enterocolitica TaxID=630 RepID=B0RL30_YEREN|nr:hypothetical protein [Yersinia enterocolitica]